MSLRIGSLFSGYGGLDMGVQAVLGGDVVWHCDIDPAASRLLAHHHPDVPNLGDITAVQWGELDQVDVLTGGFPCQDVSSAGRRAGMTPDSRSGLWTHMARAINVLRPSLVVIENVRGLLSADAACDVEPCPWCLGDDEGRPLRALGAVLGDLAVLGYDARWCGLQAADVGAPHGRYRVFVTAWPAGPDAAELGRGAAGRDDRLRAAGLVAGTTAGHTASVVRRHPAPVAVLSSDPEPTGPTGGPGGAAEDTDGAARRERRLAAPGQAQGRRARADAGGSGGAGTAADPEGDRRALVEPGGHEPQGARAASDHADAADAESVGRGEGRPEPAGQLGGPDAPVSGAVAWGDYAPAIRRWELTLGRPAPAPTMKGKRGGQQLSPAFVEWLMGLPEGHVTDVPGLSRNDQLKILGNGVVPQQAELALRHLLTASASSERAA